MHSPDRLRVADSVSCRATYAQSGKLHQIWSEVHSNGDGSSHIIDCHVIAKLHISWAYLKEIHRGIPFRRMVMTTHLECVHLAAGRTTHLRRKIRCEFLQRRKIWSDLDFRPVQQYREDSLHENAYLFPCLVHTSKPEVHGSGDLSDDEPFGRPGNADH